MYITNGNYKYALANGDFTRATYVWLFNLPGVPLPARIRATRRVIAMCPRDGYALIQTDDDRFFAGCRKNLNRAEALAHWHRSDARARLFTKAILENV